MTDKQAKVIAQPTVEEMVLQGKTGGLVTKGDWS